MNGDNSNSQNSDPLLFRALLVFCVLIFFVIVFKSPATQSLWLDETITAWIINAGLSEVLDRSVHFQAQSPFYFVLAWAWRQFFESGDFAFRSLPIFLTAGSAFALYFLARKLSDPISALFSVLSFLSLDAVIKSEFSARPYALPLLLLILSVLCFLKWLESERKNWLVAYLLLSVGSLYGHYIFAPSLIVPWLFLLNTKGGMRKCSVTLAAAQVVEVVLLIPGFFQLKLVQSNASTYSFAKMPELVDCLKAWVSGPSLVYIIAALLLARIFEPFVVSRESLRKHLFPLVIWWILPSTLLFALSRMSGNSIWVDRQFLWFVPGFVIFNGILLGSVTSQKAKRIIGLAFCVLVFVREIDRIWYVEDWRFAADTVNQIAKPGLPILLYSGLTELENPEWIEAQRAQDYLNAPFLRYPVSLSPLLIPASLFLEPAATVRDLMVQEVLVKNESVLLVALKLRKFPKTFGSASYLSADRFEKLFLEKGFTLEALSSDRNLVKVYKLSKKDKKAL